MDSVSRIIDMLMISFMKNKKESDGLLAKAGEGGLPAEDAQTFTRLVDQNKVKMLIAATLHEAEQRNIRGIWGESK